MRVCHSVLVFKDLVGIWLLESENDDQVIETLFEIIIAYFYSYSSFVWALMFLSPANFVKLLFCDLYCIDYLQIYTCSSRQYYSIALLP